MPWWSNGMALGFVPKEGGSSPSHGEIFIEMYSRVIPR